MIPADLASTLRAVIPEQKPAQPQPTQPVAPASRLHLDEHPDQPEWLNHVNAGVLKIKLSTAIIGISSIHLLKNFINAGNLPEHTLQWQVIIHLVFIFSALAMAWVDKIMTQTLILQHQQDH